MLIAWRMVANIVSISMDIFLKAPESRVGITQNTPKFIRDHECQEN